VKSFDVEVLLQSGGFIIHTGRDDKPALDDVGEGEHKNNNDSEQVGYSS
jgi:hypothetical protein